MKTGKFIPLGYYQNIKIGYGTINHINLKSIYITLNSWIIPKSSDNYNQIIYKTKREIQKQIYNLYIDKFQKESIVDLDIRTKGVKLDKKSFMNLEITLFVKEQFDIKDKNIKSFIKNLSQEIIDNNLTNKNLFNFFKSKNNS